MFFETNDITLEKIGGTVFSSSGYQAIPTEFGIVIRTGRTQRKRRTAVPFDFRIRTSDDMETAKEWLSQ